LHQIRGLGRSARGHRNYLGQCMRRRHQPIHGWPPFSVARTGPAFFFFGVMQRTACSLLLYVTATDFWRGSNHATVRRDGKPSAAVIMPSMHDRDRQALTTGLAFQMQLSSGRLGATDREKKIDEHSNKTSSSSRAVAAASEIRGEWARAQEDDTAMSAAGRLGHLEAPLVGSSVCCDLLCTSKLAAASVNLRFPLRDRQKTNTLRASPTEPGGYACKAPGRPALSGYRLSPPCSGVRGALTAPVTFLSFPFHPSGGMSEIGSSEMGR
jgi:hypothetical protein